MAKGKRAENANMKVIPFNKLRSKDGDNLETTIQIEAVLIWEKPEEYIGERFSITVDHQRNIQEKYCPQIAQEIKRIGRIGKGESKFKMRNKTTYQWPEKKTL